MKTKTKIIKKILKYKAVAALSILATLAYLNYNPAEEYTYEYSKVNKLQTNELVNLIEKADENDTITINVTNFGGSVVQILRLLDVIASDDSKIIIKSRGMAASAAGLLMASTDHANIGENTLLLFHTARVFVFGMPFIIDHDDDMIYAFNKVVSKNISEYLTDEEIDYYLSGGDLWLLGKDFKSRGKINEPDRLMTLLNAHKEMYNQRILERNKETFGIEEGKKEK